MYGVVEAAGILGLPAGRVRAWLDGYESRGKRYPPVVRAERTGEEVVTWGEFVELGFLREYRRKRVPLQWLRPVIEKLRHDWGTPYPLATSRPYVLGKELVLSSQEDSRLPEAIAIVVRSGQTLVLTTETQRFIQKVSFPPDPEGMGVDAQQFHPAGEASPVVVDPLVRFGRPAVEGVATERLWKLHDAGETFAEIAEGYEMDVSLVKAAVAYEVQHRTLAA